mmetsp:Transcript_59236/g.158513  ORF Transcript_59236/g.158513 Transcript_59236/m.158513 type:complete len:283 (+) Transcript_59236:791-1639(+)
MGQWRRGKNCWRALEATGPRTQPLPDESHLLHRCVRHPAAVVDLLLRVELLGNRCPQNGLQQCGIRGQELSQLLQGFQLAFVGIQQIAHDDRRQGLQALQDDRIQPVPKHLPACFRRKRFGNFTGRGVTDHGALGCRNAGCGTAWRVQVRRHHLFLVDSLSPQPGCQLRNSRGNLLRLLQRSPAAVPGDRLVVPGLGRQASVDLDFFSDFHIVQSFRSFRGGERVLINNENEARETCFDYLNGPVGCSLGLENGQGVGTGAVVNAPDPDATSPVRQLNLLLA